MKTTVNFIATNEGDIQEITTTTYTPDEWIQKAGDVWRFAQSMKAGNILTNAPTLMLGDKE